MFSWNINAPLQLVSLLITFYIYAVVMIYMLGLSICLLPPPACHVEIRAMIRLLFDDTYMPLLARREVTERFSFPHVIAMIAMR